MYFPYEDYHIMADYKIYCEDTIRHVELYYGIFGTLPISGGFTHIDGVGLGNENFH